MTPLSVLEAPRYLDEVRPEVEEALQGILPPATEPPERIHEAMRYSVFAGGKRLRPALTIAAYNVFAGDWRPILPVSAAIELIHTYSLIHDDLPAMDDDDFRRGRPSCHRQFGEAVAILAGDALLTLAFATLASQTAFPPARLNAVVGGVARAAGSTGGMIAGQMMDLEAQGSPGSWQVEAIHRAKTGAMLEIALTSGALLGGANESELEAVGGFGRSIGLAFQVTDDILDEVGVGASLGKTPGKDARQGKATYPAAYGLEASRVEVGRLTEEARRSLAVLGDRGRLLLGLADYLETRTR